MRGQRRSEQEWRRRLNEQTRAAGRIDAGDRVVTKDGRRNGTVRKIQNRGTEPGPDRWVGDEELWARVKFDVEPEPLWVPVSILRRVD